VGWGCEGGGRGGGVREPRANKPTLCFNTRKDGKTGAHTSQRPLQKCLCPHLFIGCTCRSGRARTNKASGRARAGRGQEGGPASLGACERARVPRNAITDESESRARAGIPVDAHVARPLALRCRYLYWLAARPLVSPTAFFSLSPGPSSRHPIPARHTATAGHRGPTFALSYIPRARAFSGSHDLIP
jgi:hypothetical protein